MSPDGIFTGKDIISCASAKASAWAPIFSHNFSFLYLEENLLGKYIVPFYTIRVLLRISDCLVCIAKIDEYLIIWIEVGSNLQNLDTFFILIGI